MITALGPPKQTQLRLAKIGSGSTRNPKYNQAMLFVTFQLAFCPLRPHHKGLSSDSGLQVRVGSTTNLNAENSKNIMKM